MKETPTPEQIKTPRVQAALPDFEFRTLNGSVIIRIPVIEVETPFAACELTTTEVHRLWVELLTILYPKLKERLGLSPDVATPSCS